MQKYVSTGRWTCLDEPLAIYLQLPKSLYYTHEIFYLLKKLGILIQCPSEPVKGTLSTAIVDGSPWARDHHDGGDFACT